MEEIVRADDDVARGSGHSSEWAPAQPMATAQPLTPTETSLAAATAAIITAQRSRTRVAGPSWLPPAPVSPFGYPDYQYKSRYSDYPGEVGDVPASRRSPDYSAYDADEPTTIHDGRLMERAVETTAIIARVRDPDETPTMSTYPSTARLGSFAPAALSSAPEIRPVFAEPPVEPVQPPTVPADSWMPAAEPAEPVGEPPADQRPAMLGARPQLVQPYTDVLSRVLVPPYVEPSVASVPDVDDSVDPTDAPRSAWEPVPVDSFATATVTEPEPESAADDVDSARPTGVDPPLFAASAVPILAPSVLTPVDVLNPLNRLEPIAGGAADADVRVDSSSLPDWGLVGATAESEPILPQRVPAEPDVPALPPPCDPLRTPATDSSIADRTDLSRIATYLKHDSDSGPDRRPDGFDVAAVIDTVRSVPNVRDAQLRWNASSGHTLRIELREGADAGEVTRAVARLLRETLGLDAEPSEDSAFGSLAGPVPTLPRWAPPPAVDPGVVAPPQRVGDVAARTGDAPRLVLDHVRVTTVGLDATVEVQLTGPDATRRVGHTQGPAVDPYLLRLAATAGTHAINDALAAATGHGEPSRCYVEHAAVVPFAGCEVAVAVVLLVRGAEAEQLSGSALVAGDPRHAVVRATLAALNRRLEVLLDRAG